jgi:hypothetical protein
MLDLSNLAEHGVTFKKFCGMEVREGLGCTGEAVGEITAQLEDGTSVPIPVCQIHLDSIMAEFDVETI